MSLKAINEGFKSRFIGVLNESVEPSQVDELRTALEDAAFELSSRQIVNPKAYEVAFQDAIERLYPDNAWWEITDCNIFWDLFENGDIDHTINEIINQLKIDTSVDEAMMMPAGSDKEQPIATNDKGDRMVYKKGLGYSVFSKNDVSLGGFDEIKGADGKVDHEAAKKKFLSGNFNESKSMNEASNKWLRAIQNWVGDKEASKLIYNWYNNEGAFEDFDDVGDFIDYAKDDIYNMLDAAGVEEHKIVADALGIDIYDEDDEEEYIDSTYHDYSEDELRKMGVFDNLNEDLISKLQECLNRLNEATISDEDQRDSDIIRGMIAKLQKRSNAKFTPEEQAVMDKYGITRDNFNRELEVGGRTLNPDYDGETSRSYSPGQPWVPIYHRNGDPAKINYADRARKLPQRVDGQVSGRGTANGQINRHTRSRYSQTLQDVERAAQEDRDTAPVRDMQYELDRRNSYTHRINNAQATYDDKVGKARKKYDDEVKWATDQYRKDTVDASKYRDAAQARIDKMLKRN